MSKHFIISPKANYLTREEGLSIQEDKLNRSHHIWEAREQEAKKAFSEECKLKYVSGRVIVKIDLQGKNFHRLSNGHQLRLERDFNNHNRRHTAPINAVVISAESIPTNSEILISHNATHETNRIFSYKSSSPDIQYFSIPENECFAWRDNNGSLQPMPNFDFALRVFKPYDGSLVGIQPKLLNDILYITTGSLVGNVVNTLKSCDYEIVFQGENGQEERLVRLRHSEDENFDREEVVCINHALTEQLNNNKLFIGLTANDAKTIKEWQN